MSDQFDTGVVTLMFTDVEGSTDLTRRLGDEVARRTIEEHRRIVRAKLAEHDGREIDSIGDGFMITFSSPRRAVACAVAIHKALADHAREHPDEEVRVRIGLNVGEVLERGGHPFGAAVNATQRVAANGEGRSGLRLANRFATWRGRFRRSFSAIGAASAQGIRRALAPLRGRLGAPEGETAAETQAGAGCPPPPTAAPGRCPGRGHCSRSRRLPDPPRGPGDARSRRTEFGRDHRSR